MASPFRPPSDTFVKGKRGEALVRLMFELHGCRVLAFGVEAHLPEVRALPLHERGASQRLRALPDLVVVRETPTAASSRRSSRSRRTASRPTTSSCCRT